MNQDELTVKECAALMPGDVGKNHDIIRQNIKRGHLLVKAKREGRNWIARAEFQRWLGSRRGAGRPSKV